MDSKEDEDVISTPYETGLPVYLLYYQFMNFFLQQLDNVFGGIDLRVLHLAVSIGTSQQAVEFGGGIEKFKTGICVRPMTESKNYVYRGCVYIGRTLKKMPEIEKIIGELKKSTKYLQGAYNLASNNCQNFCVDLLQILGFDASKFAHLMRFTSLNKQYLNGLLPFSGCSSISAANPLGHLFKLLIIGDRGVGKTSLLTRFIDNDFSPHYATTIGVNFKIRTLVIDGEEVELQIWDVAGQERFPNLMSTYFHGTHGVILVSDLTNAESFANIKRWLHEIDQYCEHPERILVGNKSDDKERRVVTHSDAKRTADELQLSYIETSAKANTNVVQVFSTITELVLTAKKAHQGQGGQQVVLSFGRQQ